MNKINKKAMRLEDENKLLKEENKRLLLSILKTNKSIAEIAEKEILDTIKENSVYDPANRRFIISDISLINTTKGSKIYNYIKDK